MSTHFPLMLPNVQVFATSSRPEWASPVTERGCARKGQGAHAPQRKADVRRWPFPYANDMILQLKENPLLEETNSLEENRLCPFLN